MSRMYLIILILVASMVTYTIWYVSSKNKEVLTNRLNHFGVAGKTLVDDKDWKYIPCTPTVESCGRRE